MKGISSVTKQARSVLILGLVLAACTAGGPAGKKSGPSPTSSRSPSPSPSPTATLIGGQLVSLEEVAAVERTVRDYFTALGNADFASLRRLSTGEVRTLAGWQRRLGSPGNGPVPFPVLKPEAVTLDSLEVVSVTGDRARVNVAGQLTETYFDGTKDEDIVLLTNISGPVTLIRSSPWRVADYSRNGRSVLKSLATKPHGSETSQGVVVRVTGVDVRPRGTVVIAEVSNTTGLRAGGLSPKITGSSGKPLRTAFPDNLQYVDVKPHSKTTIALFFPKGLGPKTKTFRFTMEFPLGCYPVCAGTASFDFTVKRAG